MNSITKDDFLKMVRLQHLEVITQNQLHSNTQILKSYMEKSLVSELSDIEKSDANMMVEEVGQLQKWEVMRDDFSKAICYTRKEQVEWEESEKGEFGEIVKAKGGVYKPTSENKKLGRVGQRYGGVVRDPRHEEKRRAAAKEQSFESTMRKYGEEEDGEKKEENEWKEMSGHNLQDDVLDLADELLEKHPELEKKLNKVMHQTIDVTNIRHMSDQQLKQAYRELSRLRKDSKGIGGSKGGEKEPKDLTDHEVNKIISEFFKEGGKLGRSIKNMPVNSTTEPILNKLHERVRSKGYLTEQGVFDMLSSDERKYLKEWSE